jgi:hypothetical protein
MIGLLFSTNVVLAQSTPPAETPPVQRDMEANLRVRHLSVPSAVIDGWFYDQEDGAGFERPKIGATAVGAELVLRRRPANWSFYFEYLGNTTDVGYWDDVESGQPVDHDDGDWVEPHNMGAVALGADIQNELRFTRKGADVGASVLFGGGLGVLFVTGNLLTWHDGTNPDNTDPTCMPAANSWERADTCPDDGNKRVPRVLPMIDVTLSAKLDWQDRYQLRFDFGVHDLLYVGLAGGVAF